MAMVINTCLLALAVTRRCWMVRCSVEKLPAASTGRSQTLGESLQLQQFVINQPSERNPTEEVK